MSLLLTSPAYLLAIPPRSCAAAAGAGSSTGAALASS